MSARAACDLVHDPDRGRARAGGAAEPAGHDATSTRTGAAACPPPADQRARRSATLRRPARRHAPSQRPDEASIRATARLQFHKDFTLDDAAGLVPYFSRLGVSHIYASPLLTARAGSTHGYDIVDHNAINPELGGEEALRRLVEALRGAGMGLILDIVPNHMGVGGADNAWWLDVLEWGRASPYAEYFDIDWDAAGRLRCAASCSRPFLGAAYGEMLAAGELVLKFDAERRAAVRLGYYAHRFPIDPREYAAVLREAGPPSWRSGSPASARRPAAREGAPRAEEAREAAARFAGRSSRAMAERCWPRYAPARRRDASGCTGCSSGSTTGSPGGAPRRTRSTGGASSTSMAWPACAVRCRRCSRHASHYSSHSMPRALIDGVRIDHVDGLADPREYCRKLRRRLETPPRTRPRDLRGDPGDHLGREDPRAARAHCRPTG